MPHPLHRQLPPILAKAITWGTVPIALFGSVGLAWALFQAGASTGVTVSSVVFATGVVLFALQFVQPRAVDWHLNRGDITRDLVHSVLWHGALPPLFRALAFGALAAGGVWVASRFDIGLWPTSWPWWVQLYAALALGEFSAYWVHRGCHEVGGLWRLHVLHHSSEELNVLSAGRNHPFNVGLSVVAQFAPLFFLGCPAEILALHGVYTGVNGALQHANINVRSGILNWVVSTPELHYWHHSVVVDESNSNYGSNLILWDIVFGTRKLPARPVTTTLGLPHAVPHTFGGQLLFPFSFDRWAQLGKARGAREN